MSLVLFLTSTFAGLAACTSATAPATELATARERWEERGPTSYKYTLDRDCFCIPETTRAVVITVQDGAVISRVYVDTGTPVGGTFERYFPAIDGLFDMVEEAIRGNAERIEVTYDPSLGAPVTMMIDYSENIDDELWVRVENLATP